MEYQRVCVYCASSRRCDARYHESAASLGRALARAGKTIVYGGGAVGSMGALADAALEHGGDVVGVIPHFMAALEWGHEDVELEVVDDMHVRKARMLELADAVVALPGGTGTFEELLEALTWKRLGLSRVPLVIVDVDGYYGPLVEMLERAVAERFLDERHRAMWHVVARAEEVLPALEELAPFDDDAREYAVP